MLPRLLSMRAGCVLRVLSYSIGGCIHVTVFVIHVETTGMFFRGGIPYGPRVTPGYSLLTCTSRRCEAFPVWPPARVPLLLCDDYNICTIPLLYFFSTSGKYWRGPLTSPRLARQATGAIGTLTAVVQYNKINRRYTVCQHCTASQRAHAKLRPLRIVLPGMESHVSPGSIDCQRRLASEVPNILEKKGLTGTK